MATGLDKIREQIKELGFGSKVFAKGSRLINKDGSFNVYRKGKNWSTFNPYHWLINMHWAYFFLFVIVSYILINSLFSFLYLLVGVEYLTNYQGVDSFDAFLHAFYFSTQTLTTLGFGKISPVGNWTNIIASFEAMIGLLSFALATGILYGRFSKAKAKILFSENALIAPFQDIRGLMFRIANLRKNHLIELRAKLMYSYLENQQGESKRIYTCLLYTSPSPRD